MSCIDPINTTNYSLNKVYTLKNLDDQFYLKNRQLISIKAPISIQSALLKNDNKKFSNETEFIEIFREVYKNIKDNDDWTYLNYLGIDDDLHESFEIKFYSPIQFNLYINRFETREEFCNRVNIEIHERAKTISIIEAQLQKLNKSKEAINLILDVINR